MPPELDHLLGEVRALNSTLRTGGPPAIEAFRQLTNQLLHLTVLAPGGVVKLIRVPEDNTKAVLGGRSIREPLLLKDDRYLRVTASLYLDLSSTPNFLKVEEISYQYQLDTEGREWIFRYDYLRNPPHAYPPAHLQIRGRLSAHDALGGPLLEKLHFPTGRVTLEGVIRLLVEQFHVPCNSQPEIWRPVLAETERDFLNVAHQPLSGPDR